MGFIGFLGFIGFMGFMGFRVRVAHNSHDKDPAA